MPRWLWWTPLALLVICLGVWGFRWGWIAATITETDVISTYAAQYVAQAGGNARLTDCTARPGERAGVWIVVRCVQQPALRYDYAVDRFGRLLDISADPDRPGAPQT
ncbi:hypothetical protein [uncultured Roseobacter sp.]|uniref:hypothetical protein n=1 Tax=uncultured Roseobacter sp. TaxID=114847 RepID=UPI002606A103|nr:hypothetical protein [uncultured Roseobacter sp.]